METDKYLELQQKARRAYEGGRLRSGLLLAWPALMITGISVCWSHDVRLCIACGLLLFLLAGGLLWRGQGWGRAVRPALLAGLAPAIAPAFGHLLEDVMPVVSCSTSCALVCVVGGVVGGGMFGYRAAGLESERFAYLTSGAVILLLTGSLGCLQMGALGFLSMLGGFVLGGIPVVMLRSLAAPG